MIFLRFTLRLFPDLKMSLSYLRKLKQCAECGKMVKFTLNVRPIRSFIRNKRPFL